VCNIRLKPRLEARKSILAVDCPDHFEHAVSGLCRCARQSRVAMLQDQRLRSVGDLEQRFVGLLLDQGQPEVGEEADAGRDIVHCPGQPPDTNNRHAHNSRGLRERDGPDGRGTC
jgi:hypothetical protein